MERREVLPVVDSVADARQDVPGGHERRSASARRDLSGARDMFVAYRFIAF